MTWVTNNFHVAQSLEYNETKKNTTWSQALTIDFVLFLGQKFNVLVKLNTFILHALRVIFFESTL